VPSPGQPTSAGPPRYAPCIGTPGSSVYTGTLHGFSEGGLSADTAALLALSAADAGARFGWKPLWDMASPAVFGGCLGGLLASLGTLHGVSGFGCMNTAGWIVNGNLNKGSL
jgi:hypothetical protein